MSDQRWHVIERAATMTVRERLERDVRIGLTASPPWLPARWFYDEKGSVLFEEITGLPEYYPTRRETEILAAHSADIASITRADTLIELGAGSSSKTRMLLDAFTVGHRALNFVPLDVSVEALTQAARTIAHVYPTVRVEALVADFEDPLQPLPAGNGARLVVFLGGTIGNLNKQMRADFFARLRVAMAPGDYFLLGADLVKDPTRLVAAYDDGAGITAAFNLNMIEVVRRELAVEGLSPDDFEHVARWNSPLGQIEMWLRAIRPVDAFFPTLPLRWRLPRGGELLTEISVKFEVDGIGAELAAAGFTPVSTWRDSGGDFSLTLARLG